MQNLIELHEVSRRFGRTLAVNNASFSIERGQVFGLLGPNGSGKTTVISMILSLIRPSSGSIRLFGSADLEKGRKRIGATLEAGGFFPDFSGEKNLKITALVKNADKREIPGLLEKVGLGDRAGDRYKNYSMGMKQRLAIASALIGNPEVVILDEPTNGLDPVGIIEMRNLVGALAREGRTVLIASHLLNEIEKICSHIAILQRGTVVSTGTLREVVAQRTLEEVFMDAVK